MHQVHKYWFTQVYILDTYQYENYIKKKKKTVYSNKYVIREIINITFLYPVIASEYITSRFL